MVAGNQPRPYTSSLDNYTPVKKNQPAGKYCFDFFAPIIFTDFFQILKQKL
jgi:hypothetical protein